MNRTEAVTEKVLTESGLSMYVHTCWDPADPRKLVNFAISCGRAGSHILGMAQDIGAIVSGALLLGRSLHEIKEFLDFRGGDSMIDQAIGVALAELDRREKMVEKYIDEMENSKEKV